MVQGTTDEKRLTHLEQANHSSLLIVQKLVEYTPGSMPALFPKPYIGTATGLAATGAAASSSWSAHGNVARISTHNPKTWDATKLAALYGGNTVPGESRNSTVHLVAVHHNPAKPLIIQAVDVQAETADDRKNRGGVVKTLARIKLPPPPPPRCRLTATPARVKNGDDVTLTIYGSGVVVGGNLDGTGFGTPTIPPTPADSVDSNDVVLATKTVRATASVYPGQNRKNWSPCVLRPEGTRRRGRDEATTISARARPFRRGQGGREPFAPGTTR